MRKSVTTSANSSASIYRACELGFDCVLAEAILSPEEDDFPATLLFVPTHERPYLKLKEQNVFRWNLELGMNQSLEAPDYLSVILAEITKLRELWIYCSIRNEQLESFLSILGAEDMGQYQKLVIVLPHITCPVASPYRICSPHPSSQIRYADGLSVGWLRHRMRRRPIFSPLAPKWSSYETRGAANEHGRPPPPIGPSRYRRLVSGRGALSLGTGLPRRAVSMGGQARSSPALVGHAEVRKDFATRGRRHRLEPLLKIDGG